jgi:carnitine O-acetyltransferase
MSSFVLAGSGLMRPDWCNLRSQLVESSEENLKSLRKFQNSLFLLVLDSNEPETDDDMCSLLLHGNGKGGDRFFDKHQMIVFDNGKAGFQVFIIYDLQII